MQVHTAENVELTRAITTFLQAHEVDPVPAAGSEDGSPSAAGQRLETLDVEGPAWHFLT
jgi:hypothetical protein